MVSLPVSRLEMAKTLSFRDISGGPSAQSGLEMESLRDRYEDQSLRSSNDI
jgi:hypothetical protein